jgi:L,D-peptidoglycan transpeptidase YkuD (ErfK/YbiS/YcfS/YnhG family)
MTLKARAAGRLSPVATALVVSAGASLGLASPALPASPAAAASAPLAGSPAARTPGGRCPDNLADRLARTGRARQLVTVEAERFSAVVAEVGTWGRDGPCWEVAGGPWTAFIGRNGFSNHHREGDGTTPAGFYAIGPDMYGNAPNPGTAFAYHRLACGDWWDEDPTSPWYNTFRHFPCGQAPPFGGASEALWTETSAYASFAVIEYNTRPVIAYAGSAIFLHASIGAPTSGCVALPVGDLDRVLRWLAPGLRPAVVMGPATEIASF